MAVDVCSEISSLVASPRISFSYDFNQTDGIPIECHHRRSDALLLDSNADFNFSILGFANELSSADELFANGKILAVEIKKVDTHQPPKNFVRPRPNVTATPTTTPNEDTKKKRLKEFLSLGCDEDEEKPISRSFWHFRRSNSLNCDNGRSKSLLRPLQFLSRSNSTGSAPNLQQTGPPKVLQKQHSQKKTGYNFPSVSPSSGCEGYNYSAKRPPVKKNCRSYGNGVGIIPILNIPPAFITKGTVSLFGFGSLLCNGKEKKKKK